MLFHSLHFLVFFPVVVALYFALPDRARTGLLLVVSYYFYMCWKAEYAFLILASTLIDYGCGRAMEREPERRGRRKYLILSLVTNLGLLFAFKYFNFVNASLREIFERLNVFYDVPAFDVLLPVGISFYTFQTLSYTIDVYTGERRAERRFGTFAVYVAFFPQLVAGPIERASALLPQFDEIHRFDFDRMVSGVQRMAFGFFQKLVIADRLGVLVNQVYADPVRYAGLPSILATYAFAYQIYCDFAGYSNIAIGAAQVMGFRLRSNFDRPYLAPSIPEFWRRWHISLSTWFRDYLYIPLGGNRGGALLWYRNLLVVFLLSGLWHGANWTFVAWGGLHAVYMLCSNATAGPRGRLAVALERMRLGPLHRAVRVCLTFHLVLLAWVFFRASSVGEAVFIVTHAVSAFELRFGGYGLPLDGIELAIAAGAIVAMEVLQVRERQGAIRPVLVRLPLWVRWPLCYGAVAAILLLGYFGPPTQFIYFQF